MTDAETVADVAALLEDECARTILREARNEPMSASELSEQCDVSPPTVYRRLEALQDHDLVAEEVRLDPDGNHENVYSTALDRVTFEVRESGIEVSVETSRRDRLADSFTDLVEEL